MYLNKYDIKDETYVKLDELNDLLKSERKAVAQKMKQHHAEGEDNMGWAMAHSQLTDFARKVNMSEDGEKYLIFTRDKNDMWEFLVDVVKWDDVPEYIRKHVKQRSDFVTVGTNEYEEATLYDTLEDAEKALRNVVDKSGNEEWHVIKKWMFDTEDNRDMVTRLFYGGDDKGGDKAAAVKMAENAITRTRAALDRTEKLLSKVKGGESEKPSDAAQKPKTRTVMNRKGAKRCPARYTVWYLDDSDVTTHCMGFVKFEKGHPLFTNRPCMATWFVWRDMAEKVAERCGDGFEVVDMIGWMTAEERLLRAIFREDGMDGDMEPEYHGDGTRAEDEDWDGDD